MRRKVLPRKTAPARNWRWGKHLLAKFAAKNITGEICGDKCTQTKLPWNSISVKTNFEMVKFRVIFEGSHCTVVVGGEKCAEIFTPPETLCLQAQKCHRKIHHKFHHPKSALAMPLPQSMGLSTFFLSVSPLAQRIPGASGIRRSQHDECLFRANPLLMLFVQIVAMSGC